MFEKNFSKWVVNRLKPYSEVPPDKLVAEREAAVRQQEFNENYSAFVKTSLLPVIEATTKMLSAARIVHRISTWGNQLSIRVHLTWRWGELVVVQSHEDAVTFEHHIITEGEKRGDDQADDHTHQYDLREPLPDAIAQYEISFFLTRLAQDMVEVNQGELPPE
jgi:hypothetical protein